MHVYEIAVCAATLVALLAAVEAADWSILFLLLAGLVLLLLVLLLPWLLAFWRRRNGQ